MAAAEMNVGVTFEGFAVVRPGDTLIVALEQRTLTKQQSDQYKATLLERIPGLADVVVLGGVTTLAAYRPDDGHAR